MNIVARIKFSSNFKDSKTCIEISNVINEIQGDDKVDFAAYTYTG